MTSSEFSSVYLDIEKKIYSCDEKALVDSTVGHPERIDRQTNGEPSSFSHQQLSQKAVPGETQFHINNKHDICTAPMRNVTILVNMRSDTKKTRLTPSSAHSLYSVQVDKSSNIGTFLSSVGKCRTAKLNELTSSFLLN
jgi:hypothetical protein